MKYFLISIFFISSFQAVGSCRVNGLQETINKVVQSGDIELTAENFNLLFDNLNKTLSGNLATVYRSEWKAKNTFAEAEQYLEKLAEFFHGDKTIAQSSKYGAQKIEDIRHQLSKIETENGLRIRDIPGPEGAIDRTFTYYTKSLSGKNGGKHQVRLRTYVRSIKLEDLKPGNKIFGFFEQSSFELIRSADGNTYYFNVGNSKHVLSKKQANRRFGEMIYFYPPHGQSFKLEIKTRLPDEMISQHHPKLEGDNYVQKLSVGLSFPQALRLFGHKGKSFDVLIKQIEELKQEINQSKPHQILRTNAVFEVLIEGLKYDTTFLEFLGATEYQRLALEIKLGEKNDQGENIWAQTTIDYGMSVRSVYESGELLMPRLVSKRTTLNDILEVKREADETHIELKIPKYLVEIALENPDSISIELRKLIEFYHDLNVVNRGKFNYIIQESDLN